MLGTSGLGLLSLNSNPNPQTSVVFDNAFFADTALTPRSRPLSSSQDNHNVTDTVSVAKLLDDFDLTEDIDLDNTQEYARDLKFASFDEVNAYKLKAVFEDKTKSSGKNEMQHANGKNRVRDAFPSAQPKRPSPPPRTKPSGTKVNPLVEKVLAGSSCYNPPTNSSNSSKSKKSEPPRFLGRDLGSSDVKVEETSDPPNSPELVEDEFPEPDLISLASGHSFADYSNIIKRASKPKPGYSSNFRVGNPEEVKNFGKYNVRDTKQVQSGSEDQEFYDACTMTPSAKEAGKSSRVQIHFDWDSVWSLLLAKIVVPISAKETPGYVVISTHGSIEKDIVRIKVGPSKPDLFSLEPLIVDSLTKFQHKQCKESMSMESIRQTIIQCLKPSRNFLGIQGNGFIFLYGSMQCLNHLSMHSEPELEHGATHAVRWPSYLTPWDEFEKSLHALADFNENYTMENDGARIRRVFYVRPIFQQEDVGFFCLVEPPTEARPGRVTIPGGPRRLGETALDCALRKLKDETGLMLKMDADVLPIYHDSAAVTFFINVDDPSLKEVRVCRKHISKQGESKPRHVFSSNNSTSGSRHRSSVRRT